MRGKFILAIFVSLSIASSSFVEAGNIEGKKDLFDQEDQNFTTKIPLEIKEIDRLKEFIENITDEEVKKKAHEIIDQIIIEDNKLDIKTAEKIAKKYYESISKKIFTDSSDFSKSICKICKEKEIDETYLPFGETSGTSTIFEPPYSSCFSWGDGTDWIDEHAQGCNSHSGSIGAYANAFVGGATAEAMQQLNFYVGRTKTVKIDAKIIRTGGKSTFGFGAFAGTEKTWSWDNFQKNYHRADVDPWWDWDIIVDKVIKLVTVLMGFNPGNIIQAILLLNEIVDFKGLAEQLQNLLDENKAEILKISFSFSATPGYHKIWVGLRATASAFITGTGCAVTMGQVSNITVDGIAAPESPIIIGPASGTVDEDIQFSAKSVDPNKDKIKYFFDWGDGSNSGWTDYVSSGTNVYKTHTYSNKGNYEIKVIVEDIDKMQSQALYTLTVKKIQSVRDHIIMKILHNYPILLSLFFKQ